MSSREPSSGVRTEDVTRELQSRDVRVHTKGPAVNEAMVGRAVGASGEGSGLLITTGFSLGKSALTFTYFSLKRGF